MDCLDYMKKGEGYRILRGMNQLNLAENLSESDDRSPRPCYRGCNFNDYEQNMIDRIDLKDFLEPLKDLLPLAN